MRYRCSYLRSPTSSFTHLLGIRAFPASWTPNYDDLTFAHGLNSAILRYAGAPPVEPTTPLVPSKNPLLESNLHPLEPMPVVRVFATPCATAPLIKTPNSLVVLASAMSIWL